MPPLTQKSLDFNPRSREGSDFWPADLFSVPPISIHAPARGATESNEGLFYLLYNFNPRSREGSDTPIAGSRTFPFEFQSTLPRGERRSGLSVYKQ